MLLFATTVEGQSLADLARKEEERRKVVPEAAKVYTNKDLNAAHAPALPPPADAAKDASKEKDPKGDKDKEKEKDGSGKQIVKDKAYWGARLKALQDQLNQNQTYAEAIQTRVNALNTDFANRDDPSQRAVIERDRQKALTELVRLKQAIVDGKKALATLDDEARRAGVPPGWLR